MTDSAYGNSNDELILMASDIKKITEAGAEVRIIPQNGTTDVTTKQGLI